jgi:rod shape-determining protein MreD
MNFYKLLFLLVAIYFLVLLQTSFFLHFALLRFIPNLAIIFALLWNFFEKEKKIFSPGLFISLYSGFLLDVYSEGYFGFFIILLLIITIFIKKILRSYV